MKAIIKSLLDCDPRAAIDCRSCRFFVACIDCDCNTECTNQGPDPTYSGCCHNRSHPGMDGCWCPKDHGCTEGQYTDEKLAELAGTEE